MSADAKVPQHLSMLAVNEKFQTLGRLSKAKDLGMKSGFAGGSQNDIVPAGHVITHFGDTHPGLGTYMESFPAENVGKAKEIGMVTRNLHPQQFKGH